MAQVIAFDDVKASQNRERGRVRTDFLNTDKARPELPMAYLHQGDAGRVTGTHWHVVDQFQIVVEGMGTLGKHKIAPYTVQFVRAHTPYGPIVGGSESGVSYISVLPHTDAGVFYLPESRESLEKIVGRRPGQIIRNARFPSQGESGATDDVELKEIPGIKDEQGLMAWTLVMAPNSKFTAPDASNTAGQYVIVVKGGLLHEGKTHNAFAVAYVEPGESRYSLQAGPNGLEAFVVNFPHATGDGASGIVQGTTAGNRIWQCALCSFVYDEAAGIPSEGIPAGTRWEDVPEQWACPDCSAVKSDFQMLEI